MVQHKLKTWQPWFKDTLEGRKRFEYRKNDRDFQEGDDLFLEEYDPRVKSYTGGVFVVSVEYIVENCPGLPKGYCIMGIFSLLW